MRIGMMEGGEEGKHGETEGEEEGKRNMRRK
jgi:hypothetical protein